DAVDASPAMLAAAMQAGPADGSPTYRRIDTVEALPFPVGSYDGVLCSSVIEYLPNPERAVAEFARILQPGGVLLLSAPNRQSLARRLLVLAHRAPRRLLRRPWLDYLCLSRNEYSCHDLVDLLDRHGFDVHQALFFGGPLAWLRPQRRGGTLILAV